MSELVEVTTEEELREVLPPPDEALADIEAYYAPANYSAGLYP